MLIENGSVKNFGFMVRFNGNGVVVVVVEVKVVVVVVVSLF
jgi:hypothetical protein